MKTIHRAILLALAAGLGLCAPAQTVPALINYQGRLANPDGSFLATGDYSLSFRVYDSATNGTLIWGPQNFNGQGGLNGLLVPVVQGYFNVMLGPTDFSGASLATAFSGTNANRFVEITVGSNSPPISPRQQILTTPFAFQAANAATANLASNVVSGIKITNALISNSVFAGISGTSISNGLPVYVNSSGQLGNQTLRQTGTNVGVGGMAISLSSGAFSFMGNGNPGPDVAVSNLSVSIAVTGLRPVMVLLIPDPGVDLFPDGSFIGDPENDPYNLFYVTLYRGATRVARDRCGTSPATSERSIYAPSMISFIDPNPQPGTNTYSIYAAEGSGGPTITIYFYWVRMVAYEL